jgi:patatin-like phospholipase/acyl hydrolase
MENYAYNYSLEKGYIEPNKNKKVPMSNLFNMIASTSSGGLLTAALVAPDPDNAGEPKFYSDDVIEIYKNQGPKMFLSRPANKGLLGALIPVSAILGFFIGL